MSDIKFSLDHRGEFDEVFLRNAAVHIERMNETGFWIGIDLPDGRRVSVNTGIESGNWFFNVEEDKLNGGKFHSINRPVGGA